MADATLSEAETERIIGLQKHVVGKTEWGKREDGNWTMEMPVEAEEQLPLRLYGRFNPRTGNYIPFSVENDPFLWTMDDGP